jgi:CHAT domain-containing protein
VKQVQKRLLDEKTAILEYYLGEKNSLLFLITKKAFSVFFLPPRKEIETSINAYTMLLSDPPKGQWKGLLASQRLSQELLLSAMKIMPEPVDRLIIIPDGLLFYLPFETLALFPKGQTSDATFLISKYAISYASSCASLLFLMERKKKSEFPKNLLAFGNPVYLSNVASDEKNKITVANIMRENYEGQGFDFSSLVQSEREVNQISGFFFKPNRDIYLKKEANEEMIKKLSLEDYQIIHFACHGFIDEKLPSRSALILSLDDNAKDDGFLQVREITNLQMSPELVVLSACQTGGGTIERGEGILGLTRVFFCAGARSVVSTIWKIDDKAAAEFMRYFYFYLFQKKDKAQALRLAKLRMLKSEYSHPFYWAAFVLNGEPCSKLSVY